MPDTGPRAARNVLPSVARVATVRAPRGVARNGVHKLRGWKLDMRCRYPGCKNKSKGPRFKFFCEEHRNLPKKEQDAALSKSAEQNG